MYPSDKKDDDFNFKRVLQCFLPLAMYPFGLKGCKKINFLINAPFGRFSLAIYPSDHFFLKALFLRRTSGESGPFQLKGIWIRVLGPLGLDSGLPAGPCEHGPGFRKSVRDFSFSFLSSFSLKRPFSGDLSHSGFWLPYRSTLSLQAALRCRGHCRSTLSGLRKAPTALP